MTAMGSTVILAAILLCASCVRAQTYTGQSKGNTGDLPLNQLTANDLLSSLLWGPIGKGDGASSGDSFSTKTRDIEPGTIETVTTSVGPDGTRTVSRTRTFTGGFNPRRTGTPGTSGPSGRLMGSGLGFTKQDGGAAWDPWAFLSQSGFGFPSIQQIPVKLPEATKEVEEVAESPVKEDNLDGIDQDVVEVETIHTKPEDDSVDCSSVETSTEAVERCINAVRKNPAAYYSMLPCSIPEYTPRPPLKVHSALATSAGKHAIDMAISKSVTHTGSDGSSMGDRIWKRAKFNGSPIAENVAGGQRSARDVVFGWMCSTGHRKNIMSCSYDSMGTGIERNGWIYWAQNFGCTKYNRCSC